MKSKIYTILLSSALLSVAAPAYCQSASHTVQPSYGTPVNGPGSEFTVNLSVDPADVDISGFSITVAYDNTQIQLVSVSDNTGQPSAGAEYTMGAEQPLTGQPNVNVFVPVIMDTASTLLTPTNIAQLHFKATPGFSTGVWLYMDDHLSEGLINGEFEAIPTEYGHLNPTSSVSDWNVY